jgi:ribosomal protein S6--L-glutamate ligase
MLQVKRDDFIIIEAATGIDIAAKIVEFIEEKHRPGQTRTRGRG